MQYKFCLSVSKEDCNLTNQCKCGSLKTKVKKANSCLTNLCRCPYVKGSPRQTTRTDNSVKSSRHSPHASGAPIPVFSQTLPSYQAVETSWISFALIYGDGHTTNAVDIFSQDCRSTWYNVAGLNRPRGLSLKKRTMKKKTSRDSQRSHRKETPTERRTSQLMHVQSQDNHGQLGTHDLSPHIVQTSA